MASFKAYVKGLESQLSEIAKEIHMMEQKTWALPPLRASFVPTVERNRVFVPIVELLGIVLRATGVFNVKEIATSGSMPVEFCYISEFKSMLEECEEEILTLLWEFSKRWEEEKR